VVFQRNRLRVSIADQLDLFDPSSTDHHQVQFPLTTMVSPRSDNWGIYARIRKYRQDVCERTVIGNRTGNPFRGFRTLISYRHVIPASQHLHHMRYGVALKRKQPVFPCQYLFETGIAYLRFHIASAIMYLFTGCYDDRLAPAMLYLH